ncbi:GH12160 [Drosophila grimshawi]|uniref:GH12160 n=1 Tax=Drosophila grimshawi TaxID=7222 RepID=B4JJX2_DROGR|nr:GH12160 [Drosophila grimshawi]
METNATNQCIHEGQNVRRHNTHPVLWPVQTLSSKQDGSESSMLSDPMPDGLGHLFNIVLVIRAAAADRENLDFYLKMTA